MRRCPPPAVVEEIEGRGSLAPGGRGDTGDGENGRETGAWGLEVGWG